MRCCSCWAVDRSPSLAWRRGAVVPADVLDDSELELRAGPPDTVGDQLGLEAIDERLGERVVVRITDRSNRGEQSMIKKRLRAIDARVLTSSVAVMDQLDVGARTALAERHLERGEDEIAAHVRRE